MLWFHILLELFRQLQLVLDHVLQRLPQLPRTLQRLIILLMHLVHIFIADVDALHLLLQVLHIPLVDILSQALIFQQPLIDELLLLSRFALLNFP